MEPANDTTVLIKTEISIDYRTLSSKIRIISEQGCVFYEKDYDLTVDAELIDFLKRLFKEMK